MMKERVTDETATPPTNDTTAFPVPTGVSASNDVYLNDLFSDSAFSFPIDAQEAVDWNTLGLASEDVSMPADFADPPAKLIPHPRLLPDDPLSIRQGVENVCTILDRDGFLLTVAPALVWTGSSDHLVPHSGPRMPAHPLDPQPLAILPVRGPNPSFAGTLIMQVLRAFPERMLRRETFPLFVHPHWCLDVSKSPLPEPLVNCMGIGQVFASHNLQSKSFLWRAIRLEQRAFAEKYTTVADESKHIQRLCSKKELLAAVQAQTIYVIMRAMDDSKGEQDLNIELLHTYETLCKSFRELCNQPFCQDERVFPSYSWEEWIFAESRRRTVLVWFLLAQSLVTTRTNARCEAVDGFRALPLPAPKTLWEARTREAWHAEHEVYRSMPRGGLDVLGDLLDAHKQSKEGSDVAKFKLDSWTASTDQLGWTLSIIGEATLYGQ